VICQERPGPCEVVREALRLLKERDPTHGSSFVRTCRRALISWLEARVVLTTRRQAGIWRSESSPGAMRRARRTRSGRRCPGVRQQVRQGALALTKAALARTSSSESQPTVTMEKRRRRPGR
jgi:hypothetical protein